MNHDPALHLAGIWSTLAESSRQLIEATQSENENDRETAWSAVVASGDIMVSSLALDLLLLGHADARMGGPEAPRDRGIRAAVRQVLAAPARDCTSRFGDIVPAATHVVAMRAVALVATAEDASWFASLAPAPRASVDLVDAWIWGARGVLAEVSDATATSLVEKLAAIVRDDGANESARTAAVRAIASSPSRVVEAALHSFVDIEFVDVRIEAVAALSWKQVLTDREYDIIRELLAADVQTPTMRIRAGDLRDALS